MWSPLRRIAEVALGPEIRQQQRKAVQAVERQQVLFESSIAQLRQEVIDQTKRDYLLLSGGDDGAAEFDRETIGKVIARSRALALRNPLVQRAIDVMVLYCFGQGVSIEAEAEGDAADLAKLIEDAKNRAELFGPEGLEACERELDATGNLFLMLYGRENGPGIPQVRCAPVEEFKAIITNPDDRKEVWLYLREIQTPGGATRKTYHPDVMYQPTDRPPQYDGIEIVWSVPVSHYAIGGFHHWRWGMPKLYAAGDWAIAYKGFLEDLATVIRSLSRYAHKLTVSGSPSQVQAAAVALRSSMVGNYTEGGETNPPPAAGSTFVQNDQAKMEVFKASGMHVDGDSGRRLLLMFAAGVGLPETFFADLANSNLATAKALDRPTEMLFLMRQTLWRRILGDIAGWGVAQMRRTSLRDASGAMPKIKVSFPPILEHDVAETVKATVAAMTLDGKKIAKLFHGAEREMARLLFQALGVDDATDILDDIDKAGGFEIDEDPEQPPGPPGASPPESQSEARVIRMFEAIRQKIEEQEKAA